MRSRTRAAIRPALLVLILLGVFSTRLSSGFGLESISSFDRLVDHPGQYLEGGVLASTSVTHKHFLFGNRRFKMLSQEGSLEGGASRLTGSSVTNAFSDGGGSLQLCLLLVFCVAVLCCASMSISPWYKSENFLLRKTMAVLNAVAALVSESLGVADVNQADGGDGSVDSSKACQSGSRGGTSQTPATKSAKKVGKKKRKSGGHVLASQPGHRAAGDRGLEKTLSNSSGGEACSEVSGDMDLGSATDPPVSPRGGGAAMHANPADIQIARIEAEAARQRELRASKLKKVYLKTEKQADAIPPESLAKAKKDDKEGAPERPVRSAIPVKPLEKGVADKGRRVVERAVPVDDRYRRGGPLSSSSSEGKRPMPAKGLENGDAKDRLGRRMAGAEKPITLQSQVLVVPRRQAVRGNPKARPQERVTGEEDSMVAPQTPERATSNASTFSSPHSSVFSPHHLSRPYAQVARGDLPLTAVPPPPPPPPRLAALPPGAVYAREFIPAVQGNGTTGGGSLGEYTLMGNHHIHVSAMPPPPLQLPEPLSPSSSSVAQTSSPTPSPFPGMSLHRRLVQASPPPANLTTSLDCHPQSSNNSYTSGSAFRGLGFPGTFDNIWSASAVRAAGEATSWLSTDPTSQSQHHSYESEKGLEAASEGFNLPRLESW